MQSSATTNVLDNAAAELLRNEIRRVTATIANLHTTIGAREGEIREMRTKIGVMKEQRHDLNRALEMVTPPVFTNSYDMLKQHVPQGQCYTPASEPADRQKGYGSVLGEENGQAAPAGSARAANLSWRYTKERYESGDYCIIQTTSGSMRWALIYRGSTVGLFDTPDAAKERAAKHCYGPD